MANHVIYTRTNGTELKLKLTGERIVDLEQRLADSIQRKLEEINKLSVAAEFLAAALPGDEYDARYKTALDIYDEMTDEGKTLRDYLDVIRSVLVSAGFLDAAELERRETAAEALEKLAQTTHEAELRRIAQSTEEIGQMYSTEATQS